MKTRYLLGAACAALVISGCTQWSIAQSAPGVYADAVHPAGAPDPEKLDQIWQVDPITGSVNITIPFTTTPAGGRGPTIPFTLHYNSASTVTLQYDYTVAATGNNPSTQFYGWSTGQILPVNTSPPQVPLGPWTTSGPYFYDQSTFIQGQTIEYDLPTGPVWVTYQGCSLGGPFIYIDASGAAHDMNLEQSSENSGSTGTFMSGCWSESQPWDTGYFTTDSSALATSLSPMSVVQPDGTHLTPALKGAKLEDSNGNLATFGSNASGVTTATDSLGRTAFSTTIPVNYAGQIPVGNYNVTTTGANGNSESYSVAFEQVSIGSFTMPHPVSGTTEFPGNNTSLAVVQPASSSLLPANTTLPVVSSITLPNLTQYSFSYDSTYGTISKIVFPTGGYVRFVWGIRGDGGGDSTFLKLSTLVVSEVCISPSGSGGGIGSEPCNANENAWRYNFPDYSATSLLTSMVTAPDGSYINYAGMWFNYPAAPASVGGVPSWKEANRLEYNSSGTLMKSVATTYWPSSGATGLPYQVATTLYDGSTPQQQYVQYAYDFVVDPTGYSTSYANVVEKDESDFNGCTISGTTCPMPATLPTFLRRTFTNYAYATSNPAFLAAHIVDKPYQMLVTDGSGHPYSLTQFGYDETPVTGTPGFTGHDDANYSTSNNVRGNLTSESHCSVLNNVTTVTLANAASACSAWVKTTHTYDLTGQVLSTTDPKGNTTSFSYTDNYSTGSPPAQTNGYLTKATYPYGHTDHYSYNYFPGQLASHTGWNNQTTQYLYNDLGNMNRLTETKYPDGGDVQISYSDGPPPSVKVTTQTGEASGSIVHTALYDGLGRKSETQVNSDLFGVDYVDTTYDANGRVYSVSNPHRSTSDPTYGITTFLYDALGRKTLQTNPDNSTESWSYYGPTTTFTDELRRTWTDTSDGLGRLSQVIEPGTLTTLYTYDVLDDLQKVTQQGNRTTDSPRNRSFTYDSLSRLLCSSNPENSTASCPATPIGTYVSGTTGYSYDANGNLQSKTDARGVTTSYYYDLLNRLTSKTYSDNTTPWACYLYDTATKGVGLLAYEWTQAASVGNCSSSFPSSGRYLTARAIASPGQGYDPMGRLLGEQQYTPSSIANGTSYPMAYTYDLAGNLTSSTSGAAPPQMTLTNQSPPTCTNGLSFPATFGFVYCYDSAGRLQSVTSNAGTSPATLFNAQGYAPPGELTGATYGSNAVTLTRTYDPRLRITSESDLGNSPTSATSGGATVTITGAEQSH